MSLTDETLVRDALRDATHDLAAPARRLVETASIRGRRLRRRRRAVSAAGALGVCVLVAVPVVVALGGAGSPTGAPVATDPGTPTAAPSPEVPQALPTQQPLDGSARWTQLPATRMLTILKDLTWRSVSLADAVTTNDDRAPGEDERVLPGWLQADLVTRGQVAGGINVVLMAPGSTDRYTCPGNLVAPDSCTEITNGAGTPFGRQSSTTTGDVTVLEVVLRGPGDGLVYVAASNSADDKWGTGSMVASDTVPLTLEELTTIATDDAWTGWEPPARSRQ